MCDKNNVGSGKLRKSIAKNPYVICDKCGKEKVQNKTNFPQKGESYLSTCKKCYVYIEYPCGRKSKYKVDDEGYLICYRCEKRKEFNAENFAIQNGKIKNLCKKCNSDYVCARQKENPEQAKERNKKFRKNNPEKSKEYYQKDKEKNPERGKNYYAKNRDDIIKSRKTPEYRQKMAKNKQNKVDNDPNYKIKCLLRTRVYQAIKNQRGFKWGGSEQLLGIPYSELMSYLESHFEEGMTKENHGNKKGQWSLEHVVCCESFDLQDESHQRKCFHYTNLVPMWHEDNMAKSDWITYNGQQVRARTLTKQQKQAHIASLNLPPYDVPNHSAAPYNPLINQIKLDLPIQAFITPKVTNPIITLATNLPIRTSIIRRIDLIS